MAAPDNLGGQWSEAEKMFGRKTGMHSHPDTHPAWMSFTDSDCPRCRIDKPQKFQNGKARMAYYLGKG